MSTDRPRYTVSVDDELLQEIEDFQFANRYKTRSSATVELIRLGIQHQSPPDNGLKRTTPSQKQNPSALY